MRIIGTEIGASSPKSVCFTFGCSDDSGAGRMGFYFAREFRCRGWQVTALCPPPPLNGEASVIDRLRAAGVEVETVPAFGGRLDMGLVRRFKAHLLRTGASLLVSMHQQDMKFAACAALSANVPYVVSGQNTLSFSGNACRRWMASRILRYLLRRQCVGVVATSQRVAHEYRTLLGFQGPVEIQPNGVDTMEFCGDRARRDVLRAAFGCRVDTRVLVSVGRITPQKNQLGLVEAFANAFPANSPGFDRFQLWMVGSPAGGTPDEAYRREVESRIAALGLTGRARITGWRTDVAEILPAADLYVQASLWEGSPLAVLEAMASGLPVIVTDNGGILPDFRHGFHGWVVPTGDLASLAVALHNAWNLEASELAALGDAARDLATGRYGASRVAGRFFELASAMAIRR